jgi:hypothetical protein
VLAADNDVKPLAGHGGDRTEQDANGNLKAVGSNQAEYLVRRLKRDRPDIAARLGRGEFKSARAAGIAAGILKVPTPLDLLRRAWDKASKRERESFIEWLNKD